MNTGSISKNSFKFSLEINSGEIASKLLKNTSKGKFRIVFVYVDKKICRESLFLICIHSQPRDAISWVSNKL